MAASADAAALGAAHAAALTACAGEGEWRAALQVLSDMYWHDLHPDLSSFRAAAACLSRVSSTERFSHLGVDALDDMKRSLGDAALQRRVEAKEKLEKGDVMDLLSVCAVTRQWEAAVDMLCDLRNQSLGEVRAYNLAINASANAAVAWEVSLSLLRAIQEDQLQPDADSYLPVLASCIDPDPRLEIARVLMTEASPFLTNTIRWGYLKLCTAEGVLDDAARDATKQARDPRTFKELIYAARLAENRDKMPQAHELLVKAMLLGRQGGCLPQDTASILALETMIARVAEVSAKEGRHMGNDILVEALQEFQDRLLIGFVMDPLVLHSAMFAYLRKGDDESASRLYLQGLEVDLFDPWVTSPSSIDVQELDSELAQLAARIFLERVRVCGHRPGVWIRGSLEIRSDPEENIEDALCAVVLQAVEDAQEMSEQTETDANEPTVLTFSEPRQYLARLVADEICENVELTLPPTRDEFIRRRATIRSGRRKSMLHAMFQRAVEVTDASEIWPHKLVNGVPVTDETKLNKDVRARMAFALIQSMKSIKADWQTVFQQGKDYYDDDVESLVMGIREWPSIMANKRMFEPFDDPEPAALASPSVPGKEYESTGEVSDPPFGKQTPLLEESPMRCVRLGKIIVNTTFINSKCQAAPARMKIGIQTLHRKKRSKYKNWGGASINQKSMRGSKDAAWTGEFPGDF